MLFRSASPARRSAPDPDLMPPNAAPLASSAVTQPRSVDAQPADFQAVAELFGEKKELLLRAHLVNDVELVHFEVGRIEICPRSSAPKRLAGEVAEKLRLWTGRRWIVSLANRAGGLSLAEQNRETADQRKAGAISHPLVRAALAAFPGAELVSVRANASAVGAAEDPLPSEENGPLGDQGQVEDPEFSGDE